MRKYLRFTGYLRTFLFYHRGGNAINPFYSLEAIELAEFFDPDIFTLHPELREQAVRFVQQRLRSAEHSYEIAAGALPGSPLNVHGTKQAMSSIERCQGWLAAHMEWSLAENQAPKSGNCELL